MSVFLFDGVSGFYSDWLAVHTRLRTIFRHYRVFVGSLFGFEFSSNLVLML
jgi:hypothetical protein